MKGHRKKAERQTIGSHQSRSPLKNTVHSARWCHVLLLMHKQAKNYELWSQPGGKQADAPVHHRQDQYRKRRKCCLIRIYCSSPEQWPTWGYGIIWICRLKTSKIQDFCLWLILDSWNASLLVLCSQNTCWQIYECVFVWFLNFWSVELPQLPTPSCLLFIIKLHLLFSLFSQGDPQQQKWCIVLLMHRQRPPSSTTVH